MNKELLIQMIDQKYVVKQKHPYHDIWIYNYTKSAQYDRVWNEVTLKCRGLVLDSNLNLVARGFNKFFNIGEHHIDEIPKNNFEVFTKMDGSLGLIFMYNNDLIVATRGSFISDQANKAKQLLTEHQINSIKDLSVKNNNLSIIVEIIYPENRIVVDYGKDEKLIVLGAFIGDREVDYANIINTNNAYGRSFEIVKKHNGIQDFEEIKNLQNRNIPNEEGYVIKWPNFRVKSKFDEYCRLHRIMTNITARDIWKSLMEESNFESEILENVPDEFYNWVYKVKNRIETQYKELYSNLESSLEKIYSELNGSMQDFSFESPRRKEFAIYIFSNQYEHSKMLMMLNDNKLKLLNESIWMSIKPQHEVPFIN